MLNLVHSNVSESDIAAILASTTGRSSIPLFGDPIWRAAAQNPSVTVWLKPLIERATAEADQPLPPLTDELYSDFFKTGARLPFERVYFERRRQIGRASIAVLLGDPTTSARLLPSFLRKLEEIMDESSWALPAHVWKEPTGKDPMVIDLFSSESANNFAEMLVAFSGLIPAALAQRIKTRLHDEVFQNYADNHANIYWITSPTNWNAVCHQGVLGAALAIEEDHALVARMLLTAARGLPSYIAGFGNDGSTSEGPGYWSYGFGWFARLNAQLEHRTQNRLSFFKDDEKIRSIAKFAPLMTLAGGQMVNFSDGGRTGRLNPALLVYLGTRLAEPDLVAQGNALYQHQAETGLNLDELRCDFFNTTRLILFAPSAAEIASAKEPVQPDTFLPDYGAIVARGLDAKGHLWELAAKGGHNAEHHNHNDCGSFLLNVDSSPALIEIGSPEYVRDFFNDEKRYTFLAARSLGHSVPFVNGFEQPAGRATAATVLKAEVGSDRVEFVVDLTACYPAEAGCIKLVRTFVFEKSAGHLSIRDAVEFTSPCAIETLLITLLPVTPQDNHLILQLPNVALRITPCPGTRLLTAETCNYRGHHGTDETVQRLRFAPEHERVTKTVIGYDVRIA